MVEPYLSTRVNTPARFAEGQRAGDKSLDSLRGFTMELLI
jgi:hypothetical protein